MYDNYTAIKAGLPLGFSTFSYKNKVVEGECDAWTFFKQNGLVLPFANIQIGSITMNINTDGPASSDLTHNSTTCSNQEVVTKLINDLRTGFFSLTLFHILIIQTKLGPHTHNFVYTQLHMYTKHTIVMIISGGS